jgi:hypothetical protein
MNVRFFVALALALAIFGINAGASLAQSKASVVDSVGYTVLPVAPLGVTDSHRSGAIVLPRVLVRASAAERARASREPGETVADEANAAVDQAEKVLRGRVRERIARVSLLVPYYAFGGARLRASE